MHSVRALAAALLACLALAGCSGDEEPKQDAASGDEAVVAAYEAYWTDLLAALDPPKPSDPGLAEHATGVELERARTLVRDRKAAREVVRGSYGHQDTDVTSIDGDKATLTDCLVVGTKVHNARSGKEKRADLTGPFSLAVDLERVDGDWKVASIGAGEGKCVLAPPTDTGNPDPTSGAGSPRSPETRG